MFYNNVSVIFFVLLSIYSCNGSKILAVFPMAVRSHYILGNALLRGLAEAGHDVTMISPYIEKDPPKNGSWTDIVLTGVIEEHEKTVTKSAMLSMRDTHPLFASAFMFMFSGPYAEKTLNHTNVQKLIESGEKFDVVIAGQFLNDAMKALATHLNAHLIIFSSLGPNAMINHLVGSPSLPSFAPETMATFPPKMSFFQRVQNTIVKFAFSTALHFIVYPQQNAIVKKYVSESLNLYDILYNSSLILVNSHVSIASPQPMVPCMIEIGGFHVRSSKNLPDDLQLFLDNATEGVIYMSMGSNIKSKDFPIEEREAIVKSFSKLKQKVLWKWEDDVLPGQPPNVKLGKWLPQREILAHPNVQVFITHGGLLSTIETIYHGVPIIAIPFFGDQKMNAYTAENSGYGVVLPFSELSEEKLTSLLEEVLTNPKYKEEAQRRSRIMKDRQVDPLENAVYWIEYVIRHNGAKHLRVAYLDLAWYQYYLLDVFAFILAVVIGLYFLLKKTLMYLISKTKKSKLKAN